MGRKQILDQKKMIEKKIEKNNLKIAQNFLDVKNEKLNPAYVSKHSSNCEKQIILLVISNGKGWHYLSVK